jgi:hypothetical protein
VRRDRRIFRRRRERGQTDMGHLGIRDRWRSGCRVRRNLDISELGDGQTVKIAVSIFDDHQLHEGKEGPLYCGSLVAGLGTGRFIPT